MYKFITGYGRTIWFRTRDEISDSIWYTRGYGPIPEFIPDGL